MKFTINLLTMSFFCLSMHGQNKSPHYVFPEFTEGIVLMKDGTKQVEELNYNALSENFAFKKDENILALSKSVINKIDTIYIANSKFIRKDNVFLELLLKSDVELYLEYKCNLESSTEASSGYGGTSQTTSGRTVSSIENRGNLYDLELPEMYKVKPYKQYWINKDSTITVMKSLSQLKKRYKDQKKDIKTYKKSNNIDFNMPQSVVKLIEHLEAK